MPATLYHLANGRRGTDLAALKSSAKWFRSFRLGRIVMLASLSHLALRLVQTSARHVMACVFSLLFMFGVSAQAGTAEPLPPIVANPSSLRSIDDAITTMYFNGNIATPAELSSKFTVTDDLLGVEIDAIRAMVRDTTVPAALKKLVFVRYTFGDPRVDQVLIEARKAGIDTTIIADLNTVMKYNFATDDKITSDFSHGTFDANDEGAASIQRLLAAGFKFGKNLLSQPIYNPVHTQRVPIMHEKTTLIQNGRERTLFVGTGNASRHSRVNRMFKIVDPALFDVYREHLDDLIATYGAGKETKDMPVRPRRRITYEDDNHFIEFAFTNGRFNPNDRGIETITTQDIQNVLYSHFADTYREEAIAVIDKMRAAKAQGKTIRLLRLTDDKFSDDIGYGVTAAMMNFDVFSPFAPFHGFGEDLLDQITAYVWQKRATDPDTGAVIFQTDEDGEPTDRDLLHDKTTMYEFLLNTVKMVDILTGSENMSNNVANAENQLQIRTSADSILARSIDYSVRELIRVNPGYAIPASPAIMRNIIARGFKLGTMDVALNDINALMKALLDRDDSATESILKKIAMSSTHMHGAIKPSERMVRAEKFVRFLKWTYQNLPPLLDRNEEIKQVIGVSLILANSDMSATERVTILQSAVARPNTDNVTELRRVRAANAVLGLSAIPNDVTASPTAPAVKTPVGFNSDLTLLKGVAATDFTVFDIDGTFVNLKTDIRIFKIGSPQKSTNPKDYLDLPSPIFGRSQNAIGQRGKYKDYEIRMGKKGADNSFMFFGSPDATDLDEVLINDLNEAFRTSPSEWQAPAFDAIIERLRTKESAARTYFNTARLESDSAWQRFFQKIADYVQRTRGITIEIPASDHIIGDGGTGNTPKAKTKTNVRLAKLAAKLGAAHLFFFDDTRANTNAVGAAKIAPGMAKIVVRPVGPDTSEADAKTCDAMVGGPPSGAALGSHP